MKGPPRLALPRIHQGETIALNTWANAAPGRLLAKVEVLYDSGDEDVFLVEVTSFTTNRSIQTNFAGGTDNILGTQAKRANGDGWVLSANLQSFGTKVAQRGQFYAQLVISNGQGGLDSATLCQGYWYQGCELRLGVFIEPGPAGGHGALMRLSTADPAAGVLPNDTLATSGAIRRLRSYEVDLTTDATAGNRSFALVIDHGVSTKHLLVVPNSNVQAASLTRKWAWYAGKDPSTTVGAPVTDTNTILPQYSLPDGLLFGTVLTSNPKIRLVSTGALAFTAADDFLDPDVGIEEWVMPN